MEKQDAKMKNFSKKLHLGCGQKYFQDWLNVDGFSEKADIKFDFEKVPWNLPENYFEEVYSSHVLEHLEDTQATMDEIWRVCKNNAKVTIIVPHFSSIAAASPFHKKTFNSQSMYYFAQDSPEKYGKSVFKVLQSRIHWYPSTDKKYVSFALYRRIASFLGQVLDFLINSNKQFFERIWCYYVGGAFEVEWQLIVVKNSVAKK